MRKSMWAALILGLFLAAPAWAQRAVSFGPTPTTTVNRPINTGQSELPIARPMRTEKNAFSLASILPKISLPGAEPVRGMSQFPTPGNMPGPNYLKQFNVQYPQTFTQEEILTRGAGRGWRLFGR